MCVFDRIFFIGYLRFISNAQYSSLDRFIDSPIFSPLLPSWIHLHLPFHHPLLLSHLSPAPVRWIMWPMVFAVYCYEIVIPPKSHSPADNAVAIPLARNSHRRCYRLHPHRLQSLQVYATRFKIQSHEYWDRSLYSSRLIQTIKDKVAYLYSLNLIPFFSLFLFFCLPKQVSTSKVYVAVPRKYLIFIHT